ncbi:MAG: hypothetical protein ACOC44_15730 [Promethearchaeia archaeon]
MDPYQYLPDKKIEPRGEISKKFLDLGIDSYKEACFYLHNLPYGYNSDYDDELILFKEQKGTCTTKHAVAAALALELKIPLHKNVGIYKFTEKISWDADKILDKYVIPYVPMVHCFLVYKDFRFDLTEGNKNGKKTSIENFLHVEQVEPFISRKEEYKLFRNVLRNKILSNKDMKGIKERTLLKAREEAIVLLKKNLKRSK